MSDLIILNIISDKIKKFSSMSKYNNVALTILFNLSVNNIVVVIRLAASGRVRILIPKSRFGSRCWYRVFGSGHDVGTEY